MAIYANSYAEAETTIKDNLQKNGSKPFLFAKVATKFGEKIMLDYTESEFRAGLEVLEDYHSRLESIYLAQSEADSELNQLGNESGFASLETDSTLESLATSVDLDDVDDHRAVEIAYRIAVRLFLTWDESEHKFTSFEQNQISELLSGVENFVSHSAHPSRAEFIPLIETLSTIATNMIWQNYRGEQPVYATSLITVAMSLGTSVFAALELTGPEVQAKGTDLRYDTANQVISAASGIIQADAVENDVILAKSALYREPISDLTKTVPPAPYAGFCASDDTPTPFPKIDLVQPLADDSSLADLTHYLEHLPRWASIALVTSYLSRARGLLEEDWLEDTFGPVLQHLNDSVSAGSLQSYDAQMVEQKLDIAASSSIKEVAITAKLAKFTLIAASVEPGKIPNCISGCASFLYAIALLKAADSSNLDQQFSQEALNLYKLAATNQWNDTSPVPVKDVVTFWQDGPPALNTRTRNENEDCFIATACYESDGHPNVRILRHWRDQHLLHSISGRTFVKSYYALSPPLANWLRHHPQARDFVRDYFVVRVANRIRRTKK